MRMSGGSDAHGTRRGGMEFLRGGIFSDLQRVVPRAASESN